MFDDDDIDPWMDKYELAFVDAAVDILGASERANCWSERNARHIPMIPTAYGIGALTPATAPASIPMTPLLIFLLLLILFGLELWWFAR